ncbi:MAG: Cro/CI family transcriptional regulator [Candidatus Thiodiazotropha endolucinida]|nr:Cro/CI family transcriptional regulator [Candidatus Thiodiazotropha taylori]MCW4324062.1 Cro/CI family transcriptional regulator [Candidatus Thiodiazotropha taylori]
MYKQDVINAFGSAANLARFFSITDSAVSQWGSIIPKVRALELIEAKKEAKMKEKLKQLVFSPGLYN